MMVLMCLVLTGAGAQDDVYVPPIYSYGSVSSGYVATLSDQPYAQSIPLGLQTGILANSQDGSFALGFGARSDFEFGIGKEGPDISFDILMGLEGMYRMNRNVAFDFMLGLAVGVLDSRISNEPIITMGPGAAALVRFTPTYMNLVSLDVGLAAYGHIGLDVDYVGISLVPFVGITFDFTHFPYLPHYAAHLLLY